MSGEQVQTLHAAFADLCLALESKDAARMLGAGEAMRLACEAVWQNAAQGVDAEARAVLENLLPKIEEARLHINLAADDVRQRMAILAQQGVGGATSLYAR